MSEQLDQRGYSVGKSNGIARHFKKGDVNSENRSINNTTLPQKRYNLVLPMELYKEMDRVAKKEQVKVVDVLRQFIKLGLWVNEITKKPNTTLLIREGKAEKQIVLF